MTQSLLRVQHSSLQFSDGSRQQGHDIEKLFRTGEDYHIKTGTEAGPEDGNDNREHLIEAAQDYKHRIHFTEGNWVAVDREIIQPGSVKVGGVLIASQNEMRTKGRARVMATFAFTHKDDRFGRIAQAAAHYATRGARKGDPNYHINVRYSNRIESWMRRAGSKKAMAFVNGDFNMPDAVLDWAHGNDFTSMGDELKRHPNTGHGAIDGMCSFDQDRRVQANSLRVLSDAEMRLFMDHFVVRGSWAIRHK
jgi:hypothetical protein